MTSASTIVDRRCATTMVVRAFMRLSSAFCTRCSLALSKALVACTGNPLQGKSGTDSDVI